MSSEKGWEETITVEEMRALCPRIIHSAFQMIDRAKVCVGELRRMNRRDEKARIEIIRRAFNHYEDLGEDLEWFKSKHSDIVFACMEMDQETVMKIKQTYSARAQPVRRKIRDMITATGRTIEGMRSAGHRE